MTFKDTNPIYVQIAERISDEILAGKYLPDARIPSVREYGALFEVNVNTAVKAFAHLAQQGIIYDRRGMGYYVAGTAADCIRKNRRREFLEEELPAVFRQMQLLNIGLDEIKALWERQTSE